MKSLMRTIIAEDYIRNWLRNGYKNDRPLRRDLESESERSYSNKALQVQLQGRIIYSLTCNDQKGLSILIRGTRHKA